MDIQDFNYELDPKLIAVKPASPRDSCRLMVIDRFKGSIEHRYFYELDSILKANDVLVFNDSKVIPARINFLYNGKGLEIFLIKNLSINEWLCLGKPGKILQVGIKLEIGEGLMAEVLEVKEDGLRVVKFSKRGEDLKQSLAKVGAAPFPPYIKNPQATFADYQTIYAKNEGSVAAPTAGLHFTEELLARLKKAGVELEYITLHVGPGTFLPVKTEKVESHKMHSEFYEISETTAMALNKAKNNRHRFIAVGTTAVRVLEASYKNGTFASGADETDIYIYPGYKWRSIDAMITNFHLPKSTLLLLVSAFAGKDLIMRAYQEAIRRNYRFYSFGDAMLIL